MSFFYKSANIRLQKQVGKEKLTKTKRDNIVLYFIRVTFGNSYSLGHGMSKGVHIRNVSELN